MTSAIYEARGKAREYSSLALNLYQGCGHGCIYCYAPSATFKSQTEFNHPRPRKGIIDQVAVDAAKLSFPWRRPENPILLCFTCDPYQPIDCHYQLTRQAIEILKFHGLTVSILSKGGRRAERDMDLLGSGDEFGASLTLLDNAASLDWEPNAALPGERIEALQRAHDMGIQTWVSLEPVIDPGQTLEIIRQTHEFVDVFKVGKMNHHPSLEKTTDWRAFGLEARALLEEVGKSYYLKEDLKAYMLGA